MSLFTDFEHMIIVEESQKWEGRLPVTGEEYYRYGALQYRLKDFYKAVHFFRKAWKAQVMEASYGLSICILEEKGLERRLTEVQEWKQCSKEAFQFYKSMKKPDPEAQYRLGKCYAYGIGTSPDLEKAVVLFNALEEHGGALFEMAAAYEHGCGGLKKDEKKALKLYRTAYDKNYEEAIFAHYRLSGEDFENYPYQREIKEAYSFRIGQLMRIAEIAPCRDSYQRLAVLYENGYPGDHGEEDIRFRKKALIYRKLEESCGDLFNYGSFMPHLESEIYQKWIKDKENEEYGQTEFLKKYLSE